MARLSFPCAFAAVPEPGAPVEASVEIGSLVPDSAAVSRAAVRRFQRRAMAHRVRYEYVDPVTWLIDYLDCLLDTEPAVAHRHRKAYPRTLAAPHRTADRGAPQPASTPAPMRPSMQARTAPALPASATPSSPVTTGSVAPISAPAAPSADVDHDQVTVAAERSQLRADMVKLEFAARTYDEPKMAGELVFTQRDDWRVLERSRDALSATERNTASSSGFEANAYINETTRTIVVAVAGTQDLRHDFLGADVWRALIVSQAPQQYYLATTYVRSVIQRYQAPGYTTECVGHSLGGGACAFVASELGVRALVINPISAGKLGLAARNLVTNYVVDGDIAHLIYGARGNPFSGDTRLINDGRDVIRLMALEKYGQLAGPILVVRELEAGIDSHKVEHALDLIAAQAEAERPR